MKHDVVFANQAARYFPINASQLDREVSGPPMIRMALAAFAVPLRPLPGGERRGRSCGEHWHWLVGLHRRPCHRVGAVQPEQVDALCLPVQGAGLVNHQRGRLTAVVA